MSFGSEIQVNGWRLDAILVTLLILMTPFDSLFLAADLSFCLSFRRSTLPRKDSRRSQVLLGTTRREQIPFVF